MFNKKKKKVFNNGTHHVVTEQPSLVRLKNKTKKKQKKTK